MLIKHNISIIVADDHPIMLKGIKEELLSVGYNVIATADNGAKALELIVDQQPMIAMLDVEMPLLSGFEVIKRSINKCPKTKFIIMTYHKENGFLVQAKKCGANGYLLKEDSIVEMEACIEAVLFNEIYYGKSLDKNIEHIISEELKKLKRLTPSERTILRLVYKGYTSSEIAEQLSVSSRTIEKHRSNIIQKLDIENKANGLVHWINNHQELIELL